MLILDCKYIYNIWRIDYKLPIYNFFKFFFNSISFIYQMTTVLIKNINKYVKSSTSAFHNKIRLSLNV